jgi:hypothetical protein
MANPGKDTLYIDVEDEITTVIEKVINAKHKVVAVVLPKRATVFQSAVNLKLLKKAAVSGKKNIVLITSDKAILAIAGSVGVHVAKTPTSKPTIPAPVITTAAVTEILDLDSTSPVDSKSNSLAAASAINEDESIELDNTSPETEALTDEGGVIKKKKKIVKIPDFSSFSLRLGLAIGAVVLLIVLWFIGFVVMPKATVTVNTNVSTTSINTSVTARVGLAELDLENNVIPATRVQVEKIDSVTVEATGQKNIGNKATGTINLTNCIDKVGVQVVPAGTRFSAGSVTFETSEQAILPESTFNSSDQCKSKEIGDDKTVKAVAVEPGEQSNVSSQTLTSSISGVVAVGSNMTGGTTENVKIVSQEDVDKATQALNGTSKNDALTELKKQLQEKQVRAVEETFTSNQPAVVASPAVGAEAPETRVTMTVNYSLLGVSQNDLEEIIDKEIKANLGDTPINVRDNGIEAIKFTLSESPNEANTILTMETVATIGPEINEEELRNSIAGKKRGDIEKQIEAIDGVRSVSVEYSPVWITTTPKSANKISIVFVEGDGNQ